jgi:hypothetical protein
MDINLTGQIAANLADNLKQPPYSAWIPIISATIGGAAVFIIGMINNHYSSKKEETKNWIKSRRNAYIDFLLIFSAPYSGNSEIYLRTVLKASEYGDLTIQKPITFKSESIESLKDLTRIILTLRKTIKYSRYTQTKDLPTDQLDMIKWRTEELERQVEELAYGRFDENFEELRTKAAEAFSSPIMDALKSSGMQQSKAKHWW